MNIITILAPLSGPLLGALILQLFFYWRIIFIIIAILAAISLVGLYLYMPETQGLFNKKNHPDPFRRLELKKIKNNYLSLIRNKTFMFGTISLGIGTIPIVAWIGISPLILMKTSHLSIFSYALWQFPIFLSAAIGNLLVNRFAHRITLIRLMKISILCILISSIFIFLLPLIFSPNYYVIIVGISCYTFAWGLTSGPLTRLTLFSTCITKGTASALMNLICMSLVAFGNQASGLLYATHNNLHFILFCGFCAIVGILFCFLFLKHRILMQENCDAK
jgi:DHA1 family multidrug/chloramphenicol efflux transport protein-like MFS transporter